MVQVAKGKTCGVTSRVDCKIPSTREISRLGDRAGFEAKQSSLGPPVIFYDDKVFNIEAYASTIARSRVDRFAIATL